VFTVINNEHNYKMRAEITPEFVLLLALSFYNQTSGPLRLRTGAMLILKCFTIVLCMLYTYKLSS
jgi:hypothetical protein